MTNLIHLPSPKNTSFKTNLFPIILRVSLFLIRLVGGGVQMGTLGTAATDWSTVACPG
jgi:hypothetical protein